MSKQKEREAREDLRIWQDNTDRRCRSVEEQVEELLFTQRAEPCPECGILTIMIRVVPRYYRPRFILDLEKPNPESLRKLYRCMRCLGLFEAQEAHLVKAELGK